MSTIEKGRNILTLINVFAVSPEKQQDLVTLLIDATQQTMRHLPGFISASIHRSLDGKKAVNYAQWESMADLEAMRKNPEAAPICKPRRRWHNSTQSYVKSLMH